MNKKLNLIFVFTLLALVFFNFVGCEKLKIDNLTANRHLKEGNRLYGDEMYKQAVSHYEEAIKLNPNLEKFYVYLGTASSMAYQPGVLPPDKNDRYKNVEETNMRLQGEIEEAKAVITEFEAREDFKILRQNKTDAELKLKTAKDEMRMVSVPLLDTGRTIDYNKYTDYKAKVQSAERRLADNQTFFQKIEEDKNKPEDEQTAQEEEKGGSLVAIQAEWEKKRDIERRQKQLKVDETTITNDTIYVETFEKDQAYIDKKAEIDNAQTALNNLNAELEASEEYKNYILKLEEVEYKTKEIEYNSHYKVEVVDNEKNRNLALEYLQKALETAQADSAAALETGNEKKIKAANEIEIKILTALSDLNSKMISMDDENESFFKESEKFRKMILAKDPDNLDNYYVMADFYRDHMKIDMVIDTYKERMNLDPKDPGVYHRYARFLRDARNWEGSIEIGLRRIYALLSPEVMIPLTVQLNDLEKQRKNAVQVDMYFNNIMKQKSLPLKDRRNLINQKKAEMKEAGELTLEEITTQTEALQKQIDELYQTEVIDKLTNIEDPEIKKQLKEAYFEIGVVCWSSSFYTDTELLPRDKRKAIIENGFKFCENALKIDPEYVDVIIYQSLLWREMVKIDGLKYKEYIKKADEVKAEYMKEIERQNRKAAAQQKMQEIQQ